MSHSKTLCIDRTSYDRWQLTTDPLLHNTIADIWTDCSIISDFYCVIISADPNGQSTVRSGTLYTVHGTVPINWCHLITSRTTLVKVSCYYIWMNSMYAKENNIKNLNYNVCFFFFKICIKIFVFVKFW